MELLWGSFGVSEKEGKMVCRCVDSLVWLAPVVELLCCGGCETRHKMGRFPFRCLITCSAG